MKRQVQALPGFDKDLPYLNQSNPALLAAHWLRSLAARHGTRRLLIIKTLENIKENIKDQLSKLAEVKLVYSTKIKYTDRIKINSPDDAFEVFWELWDKEIIEFLEEVKILLLNRANQVLCYVDLSKGVTTGSVIDTKVVLQYALKANASAVIMAHNHPSGNLNPSESDKKITLDLKNALGYANINLLDHLIIVPDRMFSSVIDIV